MKDKKDFFDNNLTIIFFGSKIEITKSGIYTISINKNNKEHMMKAFDVFNRNSKNEKINGLLEYVKESSISQCNLENIFLQVIFYF